MDSSKRSPAASPATGVKEIVFATALDALYQAAAVEAVVINSVKIREEGRGLAEIAGLLAKAELLTAQELGANTDEKLRKVLSAVGWHIKAARDELAYLN